MPIPEVESIEIEPNIWSIAARAVKSAARDAGRTLAQEDIEDLSRDAVIRARVGFNPAKGDMPSRVSYLAKRATKSHLGRAEAFPIIEDALESQGDLDLPLCEQDVILPGFLLSLRSRAERADSLHAWGIGPASSPMARWRAGQGSGLPPMREALRWVAYGTARQREWAAFAAAFLALPNNEQLCGQFGVTTSDLCVALLHGIRASHNTRYPAIIQLGCIWGLKRLDGDAWEDDWVFDLDQAVLPDAIFGARYHPSIGVSPAWDVSEAATRALNAAFRRFDPDDLDSTRMWSRFDVVRLVADHLGDEAFNFIRRSAPKSDERTFVALVNSRTGHFEDALRTLCGRKIRGSWVDHIRSNLSGRPSIAMRTYANTVRYLPHDEAALLLPAIEKSPHVFIRHSANRTRESVGRPPNAVPAELLRGDARTSYLARTSLPALSALDPDRFVSLAERRMDTWLADTWLAHDVLSHLWRIAITYGSSPRTLRAEALIDLTLAKLPRFFCPFLLVALVQNGFFESRREKTPNKL